MPRQEKYVEKTNWRSTLRPYAASSSRMEQRRPDDGSPFRVIGKRRCRRAKKSQIIDPIAQNETGRPYDNEDVPQNASVDLSAPARPLSPVYWKRSNEEIPLEKITREVKDARPDAIEHKQIISIPERLASNTWTTSPETDAMNQYQPHLHSGAPSTSQVSEIEAPAHLSGTENGWTNWPFGTAEGNPPFVPGESEKAGQLLLPISREQPSSGGSMYTSSKSDTHLSSLYGGNQNELPYNHEAPIELFGSGRANGSIGSTWDTNIEFGEPINGGYHPWASSQPTSVQNYKEVGRQQVPSWEQIHSEVLDGSYPLVGADASTRHSQDCDDPNWQWMMPATKDDGVATSLGTTASAQPWVSASYPHSSAELQPNPGAVPGGSGASTFAPESMHAYDMQKSKDANDAAHMSQPYEMIPGQVASSSVRDNRHTSSTAGPYSLFDDAGGWDMPALFGATF